MGATYKGVQTGTLGKYNTISFNGKARYQKTFPAEATQDEIQEAVLKDEKSQKYLDGKRVIKVIIVPKRIVNVVVK